MTTPSETRGEETRHGTLRGNVRDSLPAPFAIGQAATAFASDDAALLANALKNMGAADRDVDEGQFATDLRALLDSLRAVQPQVRVEQLEGGSAVAAQINVDDQQVTDVLLKLVQAADRNGVKLPREVRRFRRFWETVSRVNCGNKVSQDWESGELTIYRELERDAYAALGGCSLRSRIESSKSGRGWK